MPSERQPKVLQGGEASPSRWLFVMAAEGFQELTSTQRSYRALDPIRAVLIQPTFDGASTLFARYGMPAKLGTAMAARMPMMATAIIYSTKVKP
jgi:hypothetical protein